MENIFYASTQEISKILQSEFQEIWNFTPKKLKKSGLFRKLLTRSEDTFSLQFYWLIVYFYRYYHYHCN